MEECTIGTKCKCNIACQSKCSPPVVNNKVKRNLVPQRGENFVIFPWLVSPWGLNRIKEISEGVHFPT